MSLKPGLQGQVRIEVTPENLASTFGNTGIDVLATLKLLASFEQAAARAVAPHLLPGQTTVGTHLEMDHFAPTPEGLTAVVTATLEEVVGPRLTFAIEVRDDLEPVGKGAHVRYIVDRAEFLERIRDKKQRFAEMKLNNPKA
jgi:fluoroacetyl-CoA thioesterase